MPKLYIEDIPADISIFDFDIVARSLAAFLVRESEGAKVVGLHGPWGSGKTTLMKEIRKQIDDLLPKDETAVFIEFNAWKFQDRQTLWRALILHVIGELRSLEIATQKIEEMVQALYHAFEVEERGPWRLNWRALFAEGISIVLSIFKLDFVWKALKGSPLWLKAFFVGSDTPNKERNEESLLNTERLEKLVAVLERSTVTRHVEHVRSIEQFLDRYKDLISQFSDENIRVFVLIDDLDRCLPEAALEVFEAIKLFLDAKGCDYVVALDREVIRNGLAVRYSAPGEAARGQSLINLDEYIEKTISLSFDIPRLSDEDVLELVSDFEVPFDLDATCRELIFAGLGHNPRRVKRFFNTLSLQLQIASSVEEKYKTGSIVRPEDSSTFPYFLKLLLISYRHSGLFNAFLEDPALAERLQRVSNAYKTERDKEPIEARTKRKTLLQSETASIRRLQEDEEFWRLMALPPNLFDKPELFRSLLRWFRSRRN